MVAPYNPDWYLYAVWSICVDGLVWFVLPKPQKKKKWFCIQWLQNEDMVQQGLRQNKKFCMHFWGYAVFYVPLCQSDI